MRNKTWLPLMHSNLALWLLSIFASLTVRVWIWMWQMGKVKSSLFTQSKRCFTFVACHIRCYMFSVVRRFFLFYFQRYFDARMRACWQGDIYLIESWCEFFLSFWFLADFGIHFLFVFFDSSFREYSSRLLFIFHTNFKQFLRQQ